MSQYSSIINWFAENGFKIGGENRKIVLFASEANDLQQA